jgi:hypothetical protein
MAAGKYVSPERFEESAPAPVGAPSPAPAGAPVQQEKMVAEITHELGNFFHKLYYWSDYLQEKRSRRTQDVTATQMLDRTIRNLEGFLKRVLEYFHPAQLALGPMPAADVVAGVIGHLRGGLNGTPLTVSDASRWEGRAVMVDPLHFPQAVEVLARHLAQHVGPASTIEVRVEPLHTATSQLHLHVGIRQPNDASPLFQTATSGIEWAVAERVVALHGGALTTTDLGDAVRRFDLRLPLVS